MKKNKPRIGKQQLIRISINMVLIFLGIITVILLMYRMQRVRAERRASDTAQVALEAIIETLDSNTHQVELLCERFHSDNKAVLGDMRSMLSSEGCMTALTGTEEERTALFAKLSSALSDRGHLLIVEDSGTIVAGPEVEFFGVNMVENGTLTRELFDSMCASDSVTENAMAAVTPKSVGIPLFLYGVRLAENYSLVYCCEASVLEEQYAALRDLAPILSGIIVGDNGFIFAADASTGCFLYFNGETGRLDGQPIASAGLTPDVLKNQYSGLQTINGVEYRCTSRTYKSDFYGEHTVITAVGTADSIFSGSAAAIALTALVFASGAGIMLFYASQLSTDPDQLAHYDEEVRTTAEAYRLRYKKHVHPTRNIRIFKLGGMQYYFKLGIAGKLSSVIVLSLILIFAASWNAQMLTELSKGIQQAEIAATQLDAMFDDRETSSAIIVNSYKNQYRTKIRLLSFILEEDPVFADTLNASRDDRVRTYLSEDLTPLKDDSGRPVRSVPESEVLQALAANNALDFLAVYDDHGNTIGTTNDAWYFTVSREKGFQSAPFFDIITGKTDEVFQDSQIDEFGNFMQYIGTVFHYYRLEGDGPADGRFVSRALYENAAANGGFTEFEGDVYAVSRHRSLLQGGINDETLNVLSESMENDSLMKQLHVGKDGFVMLFDNSPEHLCVWSPVDSAIGLPAASINIPGTAFSGTYKGFAKLAGEQYFQTFSFRNGYWIVPTIPMRTLVYGRDAIALMTTLISSVFFLVLFMMCVFSNEIDEDLYEEAVAKRAAAGGDNGMVQVTMPNGKVKYVRSASARFSETSISWANMNTNQRLASVLHVFASIVTLFILASVIWSDQIFGPDSAASYIVHGDWERSVNFFSLTASVVLVICVAVLSYVVSKVILFVIRNMGSRTETVGRLLLSVIKYGSVLFTIFYGLSLLGLSTTGLVTSAGILSIVVGLGAQSLIGDILSGIFIVFEGAFRVGDIVTVADFRGTVVDIGLRTTKIENTSGDIKIFNNASIAGIINMTKKASKAVCTIGVEYGADIEAVERVLNDALPAITRKNPSIINPVTYLGVLSLDDSAVTLGVLAECAEADRIKVGRYLNRELLLLFRKNGITVPFPQVTLSYLDPEEPAAPEKEN